MSNIQTNVIKPKLDFFENDNNYLILDSDFETDLDQKMEAIDTYIHGNSGKGKLDPEKDELYKNAQELWKDFAKVLRDSKYNFYLNRKQWKFLTDLILLKLEYDVNTVFFAIDLIVLLDSMRESKFENDKELKSFKVDATEITYVYHLISKHKVKGLTRDAFTFSEVLKRIGDISKVFNYYDTTAKNLSKDIQDWVLTFDDGVISDKFKNSEEETVKATILPEVVN
jgi:hypothetical protein